MFPCMIFLCFEYHRSISFGIHCSVCDVYALCLQVHKDESTGHILNLVMVQADEGTMLKVNLPVEFKGESACPGLKKGIASFLFIFQQHFSVCSA